MKPGNKDRPESKVSNLMFYAQSTTKLFTLLSGLSFPENKDRPESKVNNLGQTLKTRTDLTPPQCRCICNQSLFIMKGKTKQTQSL